METYKKIAFYSIILLISISLLFLYTSNDVKKDEDAHLKMIFLDVGQGDATFIQFPNGEQMLIDCGIDAVSIEALGRVMPFYDRDIDYLLVSHPDLDHYGGCIDVLNRFDVHHILYNGEQKQYSQLWQSFMRAIQEEQAMYSIVSSSVHWNIAGVGIDFLYPDHSIEKNKNIPGVKKDVGSNNASIVMKLSYGDQDTLLTADAEAELEEYLVDVYGEELDVEILKLGHHGSLTSSIQPFLDAATPETAVASAGMENKFHHPSERVIRRVKRMGTEIWRTDISGDIMVSITTSTHSVDSQK